MRVSGLNLSIVALLIATCMVWAEPSAETSESKLATLKKNCLLMKKTKSTCACIAKNIDRKFKDRTLSDQQLSDVVEVFRAPVIDSRLDYMADLIAGIEFHCMENPNYSGQ